MHDNLKKLLQKEMTRKNFLHLIAIGIISILGFGGVISFLLAHASTPDISAEAEGGTLAGGATIGSDTNASGDEYVKFGTAPSGGSGSPTPMMSEYSSYVLADGGDFEFAQMATESGTNPSGFGTSYADQAGTVNELESNVSIVNGTGLQLILSSDSNGACIDTASVHTSPGFACAMPFYREVEATCAVSGNYNTNHPGSWLLSGFNGTIFECDMIEVLNAYGDGNNADASVWCHLHAGTTSDYQASDGINLGVLTGSHKVGAYVSTSGVIFYIDGEYAGGSLEAATQNWPGNTPPDGTTMFALHQMDDADYGGAIEVDSIYTVNYDRFFVQG